MVHCGQQTRFALEAGEPRRVELEAGWEHLDSDLSPQLPVLRSVDDTHAAGAEPRDDVVVAEPLPDEIALGGRGKNAGRHRVHRHRQKAICGTLVGQQPLHFAPQILILTTLGPEIDRALGGLHSERTITKLLDPPPALGVRPEGRRRCHCCTCRVAPEFYVRTGRSPS